MGETAMNDKEFYQWSLEMFDKIEGTSEFQNVDSKISKYYYHMVIKMKRNYMAIHKLFDGEWQNSCIEAIPLIRILAEAYFHFCYIIDEDDHDRVVKEYNELAALQAFKVAKSLKEKGTRLVPEEEKFIELHYEGKKRPKPPQHLQYVSSLVEKISPKNEVAEYLYTRIYNIFSSYVHLNPSTSVLYGTQVTDKKFVFDNIGENKELYEALKSHTNGIIILLLTRLVDHLNIQSISDELFQYYDEEKKIFNF
jgi:hypothetical protein